MSDCPNTAQRLWQTWDGGDGKTWIDVPCGTRAGHIQYLCMKHKNFSIVVPAHFKQDVTQREHAKEMFDAARASGTELQKA